MFRFKLKRSSLTLGRKKLKNPYFVLGVKTTASQEEIKRAYRELAQKYHPDKNIEDATEAAERFHEIQAAYNILSDAEQKLAFDSSEKNRLVSNPAQSAQEIWSQYIQGIIREAQKQVSN